LRIQLYIPVNITVIKQ